jgi:hypothetical protein
MQIVFLLIMVENEGDMGQGILEELAGHSAKTNFAPAAVV